MSGPAHLSDAARAVWAEIEQSAAARGVLGPSLEAYCVQVARMRDAQARIDAEGLVVADEKGRPVEHPAVKIERAAQAEVRAWEVRFAAGPKVSKGRRSTPF